MKAAAFWAHNAIGPGIGVAALNRFGGSRLKVVRTAVLGLRHIAVHDWSAWLIVRMLALALGGLAVAMARGNVFFDTTYYAHWAHGTLTGTRVPYRDFPWEYPPGALPLMLLPGLYAPLMHDGRGAVYLWLYGALWVAFMLAVDGALLRVLLRRTAGVRTRHPAITLWIWGPPMLGALCWARYDLLPAAAAAAGVLAAAAAAPDRAGIWAGAGATLKLWPSLIAPVQRTPRAAVRAVAWAGAVVAATSAATFAVTGSTGFGQVLSYQARRGLQCESLAALPYLWLRHMHVAGLGMSFRFGAYEVTGGGIGLLTSALTLVYALGLLGIGIAHWRLMRRGGSASAVALTVMAVILLTLVTNKVFSPQYMLWLLGILAAACILDPVTWRPYVRWVLLGCALTTLAFPWFYGDILGHAWFGLLALTIRDVVVVGLALAVLRELLWRLRHPTEATDTAAATGLQVAPVSVRPVL